MKIRAFITHKKAEHFTDCQDRLSVNKNTQSIALSDGMGSTWQQKIWANLLVEKFTESEEWLPSKETIKDLSIVWRKEVEEFIKNLEEKKDPTLQSLIYRNQRNLAEGKSAGATFVGLRLKGNTWKGVVLGDSCLIRWDGENMKIHTSQESETFDNYPDYFDSDARKEGKGTPKPIEFKIEKDITLFMVSDPFSEFLHEREKENKHNVYLKKLIDIRSHEEFESLVSEWRSEGMHNDDTTLIVVSPEENLKEPKFELGTIDNLYHLIEGKKEPTEQELSNDEISEEIAKKTLETSKKKMKEKEKEISGKRGNVRGKLREIFRISKKRERVQKILDDILISSIKDVLKDYNITRKEQ